MQLETNNNEQSTKKLLDTKFMDIRWGDMDAYGHVNNTIYFLYAQEARFEMLIKKGFNISPHKTSPILAQADCKFIKPITYPESIKIETWFAGINGKKVFFEHIIKSKLDIDTTYAIIESTIVWYDFENKKSVEVPSDILQLFGA